VQEWDDGTQDYYDQAAFSYGMHVEVLDPTGHPQLSRVIAVAVKTQILYVLIVVVGANRVFQILISCLVLC